MPLASPGAKSLEGDIVVGGDPVHHSNPIDDAVHPPHQDGDEAGHRANEERGRQYVRDDFGKLVQIHESRSSFSGGRRAAAQCSMMQYIPFDAHEPLRTRVRGAGG